MQKKLLIITACFVGILFSGCSRFMPDYQNVEVEILDILLNMPEAEYRDVAWLDEDTLAFVYRKPEYGDRLGDYRLALYTLNDEAWQDLPTPSELDKCFPASLFVNYLSRLPNGNLGFTYSCDGKNGGLFGMLYEWDRVKEKAHLLIEYSPPFVIGEFAFALDMSQWIQAERNGAGLNDELYWVKQGEEPVRILADFKRASAPAWSPDGNSIVLIGTEIHPDQPNGPQTWSDIKNLALYPWDLYRMNADGSNLRIIFPKLGRPYQVRWSNEGERLFFAGRRPNAEGGVWRLDLETNEIIRFWEYNTSFDFSPDQTR